ncbi:MAG TPA: hypothetical protein VMY35_09715 [Phycisphaerae bacterium]|nr:hypothetical protein [Phycisphaerae bacterium]
MRWTMRTRLLLILTPMLLAVAFAAGCIENKRPYAASQGVLTFEGAEWVELDGRLILVGATWKVEKGMTLEDVRYNFRQGVVLTPGFAAEVLQTFAKEK